MYDSVIVAILPFLNPGPDGHVNLSSPELNEKLSSARTKIQLYGYSEEISEYELFLSFLLAKKLPEINSSLRRLSAMITSKIRNELGF